MRILSVVLMFPLIDTPHGKESSFKIKKKC